MAGRTLFPSQMFTLFTYYNQANQITNNGYTYGANGKMTSDGKRNVVRRRGIHAGQDQLALDAPCDAAKSVYIIRR
jgi:hypothetical protein